ncbi:hypothetical protein MIND_00859200 [Mycena indigotica]|uniref:DUF7598 domain-containing protein n=1 Tax=Mycena indigotica TaxID=2126181 RepID=A0A8H6W4N2_9AGAR|nr:uncharacterized protein MIND_00859200 [Mycena indigotica]KAF7299109.1 hypothetical protein MIND_00859200 [Mycena indigotica]
MLPPRAYIFIGLNGLRILSIIGLILVFASNIVTLVHDIQAVNHHLAGSNAESLNSTSTSRNDDYIINSTVPNQPAGVFWAVLNRLLLIFQVIVLLLSEVGWPSAFFNRFFPILGKEFGLGPIGIIQCLLGAAILSHHVDRFSLVSAFFLFSIGCLNIFAGLVFRASARGKRSITSWREHAKESLPTHVAGVDIRPVASAGASVVSGMFGAKEEKQASAGNGFGLAGERAAGLKGYLISKPLESLPRYAPKR